MIWQRISGAFKTPPRGPFAARFAASIGLDPTRQQLAELARLLEAGDAAAVQAYIAVVEQQATR